MTSLRTPVEALSVGHPTYSQTFPCEPSTAELGRELVLFTEIATDRQVQDCRALVRACALGAGILPDELRGELTAALRAGDSVIRESLARP